MMLNEFMKMLGEEIEEYEFKPELSVSKKRTIEFFIALEEKLNTLPSKKCNNLNFSILVKELSKNKKQVNKSKSCLVARSNDTLSLAGVSSMSTVGSISSIELEEDAKRKDSMYVEEFDTIVRRPTSIQNFDFAEYKKQLKEDTISSFEELEKQLGEISDYSYLYGFRLFKNFVSQYGKSRVGCEMIYPSITEKGLIVDPKKDVLTPLRLLKACFLIAFKMLEEESELFLADFCSYVGEEASVLGRIEMMICLEYLNFGFGGICFEDLKRDEENLLSLEF